MKDWTWNSKSIYTTLWASNHSEWDRQVNDYYATDPVAIDKLLKMWITLNNPVYECACWEWHLAERLKKHWYDVIASDLIDRWYWESGIDFLWRYTPYNWDILTNPPYSLAYEFVEKAIELIEDWKNVYMFLRLQFLEWQKRYKFFKENPPKTVYVFSKRVNCAKNWKFDETISSAIAYAWFHWEKGFKWDPVIKWIE